jgi:hypothetical protein
MGADLWCQQDIQLPSSAPSGKLYTLYWVWDWPTAAGVDPTYPNGKAEIYTTCMDVDVVAKVTKQSVKNEYDAGQDLNSAAIPNQFDELGNPVSSQVPGTTVPPTTMATLARSTSPSGETTAHVPQKVTVTDWETSTSTVYMTLPT